MRILTITFALLLSSCATYYAHRDDFNQQISLWLKTDDYQKIYAALNQLPKSHVDYQRIQERRPNIAAQQQRYVATTIAEALQLQAKEQWQPAVDLLTQAIDKTYEVQALDVALQQLLKERDTQVAELSQSLLLKQARWLIQNKRIYERLNTLVPEDDEIQDDIAAYHYERRQVLSKLLQCSKRQENAEASAVAETCLNLAYEIEPDKKLLQQLQQLASRSVRPEADEMEVALIRQFQNAYQGGDLPAARQYLDRLLALNPESEQIASLQQQLNRGVNAKVEAGILEGEQLYASGKVLDALAIWQTLVTYDPKNERLLDLIARAEKVRDYINTLKQNQ